MADFMTRLFESIFVPGPTAPLVQATNAAFAGLQLILIVMLAVTRSAHFLALSVLCGGLWWSINWFVVELAAAKEAERGGGDAPGEEKRDEKGRGVGKEGSGTVVRRRDRRRKGIPDMAEDSGTETEDLAEPGDREATVEPETPLASRPPGLRADETVSKRQSSGGDVSGTDSEWDKVSETEGLGD